MKRVIDSPYKYKTPDLCRALNVTRQTIVLWERKGILTCPRTIGNQRIFTAGQIEHIRKAFQPGGKGFWHFQAPKVPVIEEYLGEGTTVLSE